VNAQAVLKITFAGLVISFLGSLPLGTMNIAATQIAINQGTHAGLIYALGSMGVELIVVRIILVAMDWLSKRHKVFQVLELFTTALVFALAIASFIAAFKGKSFSDTVLLTSTFNPFWSGVLISASNPLHIPFWMGWTTVLLNKNILVNDARNYNWYLTGIGMGTMLGFMVFIYGGNYMIARISQHQNLLNLGIGAVLLLTAIIQLRKIMAVPAVVRYGKKMK